jgi:hypothetical protein
MNDQVVYGVARSRHMTTRQIVALLFRFGIRTIPSARHNAEEGVSGGVLCGWLQKKDRRGKNVRNTLSGDGIYGVKTLNYGF